MRAHTLQRAAAGLAVVAGLLPVGATGQLLRERAEDASQVTATLGSARPLVQSVVVAEGAGAFQLANPAFTDEQVVLNPEVRPDATTRLFFESRLAIATTNQVARVEVSTNSGGTWSQIWSQAGFGTNSLGQGSFSLVNVPLASFAGQTLRIRFRYDYIGGDFYPQTNTSPPFGWFIDDIQVGARFEPRFHAGAGDPSPDEILLLEYINRARTNETAEALRLRHTTDPEVQNAIAVFDVDLDLMEAQFATLSNSLPPLAMNHRLLAAARLHSQDMFNGAFQSHDSSTNALPPNQPFDDFADRISRQGYPWQTVAENIYSFAESAWFAHAGFNIDWGDGPGGMQSPPGHREAIHSPVYREAGIGVVTGTNTVGTNTVGPMVVTQDFALPQGGGPLLTGVAISDTNANLFYDPGEGLAGVRVEVAGGSSFTVSSTHGAFSLPLPGDGTHELTFRRGTWAPVRRAVTVTNGHNIKADFLGPRLRVESLRRTGPTQARILATVSPGHSSLAVLRSGDLQSWTNTTHTSSVLTNGLLQVDVTLPSPADRLYFRVETGWTNL